MSDCQTTMCINEKDVDFNRAANGIIGLETSVPLCLKLVADGILTLPELIDKMSAGPARILGLNSGIEVGLPADITILDPDFSWTVDAAKFRSLSRNTHVYARIYSGNYNIGLFIKNFQDTEFNAIRRSSGYSIPFISTVYFNMCCAKWLVQGY